MKAMTEGELFGGGSQAGDAADLRVVLIKDQIGTCIR